MAATKRNLAAANAARAAKAGKGRRTRNTIASPPLCSTTQTRGCRNLNNPQTEADDTCNTAMAEAQEEIDCLEREEQEGQVEEIEEESDTELKATLAKLEQLKAQKAERENRHKTTASTTVRGPQPIPSQGESPLSSIDLISAELFQRYPAIDEVHFKAVKENKFKPINLVKLTTEMTLDRNKVKVLTVGLNVALETREEDALSAEVKGLPHFIRCFLIYMEILLHFTHDSLQKPLRIGMVAYIKHLWGFNSTCTFESIRQYHFLFHSMRIQKGIDDGALWEQGNTTLKRRTLKLKHQPEYNSATKRFNISTYPVQFPTASNAQSISQANQFN
ncbi:hypothetical protein MMC22_008799 [Lobaria immixta]|nr:hypothetical protein [Lobaria immixta]